MNESKNLPRRRPLARFPSRERPGPGGRGYTPVVLPSLSLSESMSVSPSAHPWRGHRWPERARGRAAGELAATGCAAMTCVGVGERGTHGKEGGGRIRGERGGLGDDGRRHPSKGCRPALLLLLLPACLWQACMHVASALCRHVPGRPSSSPGAHSEAREGRRLKSISLAFYCRSVPVPGRRKLLRRVHQLRRGPTRLSTHPWRHSLARIQSDPILFLVK